MNTRIVRMLTGVLLVTILAVTLIWGKRLLTNAATNAQIRAVQEAYNERQVDREQARRMLGELGAVVDAWPPPPDPESLPVVSLDDVRNK